ncbi:Na+/H+ antiporter subunit E [Thiomicrospira sp. WB1]|uniref:Na+/H+ antiporter subunit E n=1 Tax=Thiomicrospira sp. WB1 TaxID=1685380 RepID=UPI00074A0AFF|nr:Na+/H+ antiporter subunit E [Thiomicrospira sp. WB1]KUJ71091.1 hypothetical protein AVO41_09480 [Thiomicrospira sp. WB1]
MKTQSNRRRYATQAWRVMVQSVGIWLLLMLAWWALTEGASSGRLWGAGTSAALTVWVLRQGGLGRLHWQFLPGLVFFYLVEAFQGGLDVAMRALRPRPALEACFLDYRLTLTTPWARSVWIGLIGLMPGTLAVGVEADRVRVHVLDQAMTVLPALQRLEWYLQRLAGECDA